MIRDPQQVITPRWYTTQQVAVMLGYGLTKTKYLVAIRTDPFGQGRRQPARAAGMGGRVHPRPRKGDDRVTNRRNGEASIFPYRNGLRGLCVGDHARTGTQAQVGLRQDLTTKFTASGSSYRPGRQRQALPTSVPAR